MPKSTSYKNIFHHPPLHDRFLFKRQLPCFYIFQNSALQKHHLLQHSLHHNNTFSPNFFKNYLFLINIYLSYTIYFVQYFTNNKILTNVRNISLIKGQYFNPSMLQVIKQPSIWITSSISLHRFTHSFYLMSFFFNRDFNVITQA